MILFIFFVLLQWLYCKLTLLQQCFFCCESVTLAQQVVNFGTGAKTQTKMHVGNSRNLSPLTEIFQKPKQNVE